MGTSPSLYEITRDEAVFVIDWYYFFAHTDNAATATLYRGLVKHLIFLHFSADWYVSFLRDYW